VTLLRVGLVLALAVTATVVANMVLLGVATGSGGPGHLSPRAAVIAPARSVAPPRPVVLPPSRGEHEQRDD
jgi:hypothetical protein